MSQKLNDVVLGSGGLVARPPSLVSKMKTIIPHEINGTSSQMLGVIPANKSAILTMTTNNKEIDRTLVQYDEQTVLPSLTGFLTQQQLDGQDVQTQWKIAQQDENLLRLGADTSWARYQRSKELDDLNNAIHWNSEILDRLANKSDREMEWTNRIAVLFLDKAQHLGQVNDINKAVEYCTRVVKAAPCDDPDKQAYLNNLGNAYYFLFSRLGELYHLSAALECYTQAISLVPDSNPDKPTCLSNLGSAFYCMFVRQDKLEDLYHSIEYYSQAVALVLDSDPHKPICLSNLGSAYHSLFERLGDLKNIHTALEYHTQAVILTPNGHLDRPVCLNNLGSTYHALYERSGELSRVHSAIECYAGAVDIMFDGHPEKLLCLDNLGGAYDSLFHRLGELDHLYTATKYYAQALALTPGDHPDRLGRLNNLGNSHHSLFDHSGEIEHIHRAISCYIQALTPISDNDPDKPSRLNNLGGAYYSLYKRLGSLEHLHTAIGYDIQAIELIPKDHSDKPVCLKNLGDAYYAMFKHLNLQEHLDDSIRCYTQALEMTPEGHPNQAWYLNTLGKLHFLLYEITDQSEDAYKSCNFFRSAALSPKGHPSVRLEASTLWAPHPMNEASNVLQAYGYCMELLPKAVWLGTTIHRRYECLSSDVQGVAEDAVMIAIAMGHYDLALEWLEQGRCLIWSQMLQLRTPVDSLGVLHPEIAKEFKSLSHRLENISGIEFERQSRIDHYRGNSVHDTTHVYSQLAHQRDQLIENIRLLPSFEDFLRPPKASKLASHVQHGVAVVVQVQMLRCDAIIIDSNTQTIAHVPLASFSLEKADDLRNQISMCLQMHGIARGFKKSDRPGTSLKDLLATLWSDIVEPVLDHLGIGQVLPVDRLPRITWCVTGALAFLPIHAAGIYDKPNKILSNLAISSYTPNLSSMGQSHLTSPGFSGVLAVGHQSSIRNFDPLPGTKEELDILEEKLVGKKFTRLDEGAATTKAVLEAMNDHSWVHFACHGSQDPKDPQKSAFHLHDDDLDLATISRHPIKNAELAILSACQTAAGDSALPDEAVHLAAGLLMAGYSNVIATMWSISDEDAPIITRKLYECLMEDGVPDSRKSAKALHVAVKHLQDTIGVENFTRWVPYIHIGG